MKKAALLIGINYRNTNNELTGCITDVKNIENILTKNLYYTDITKLTDDDVNKPTKSNILSEFNTLLNKINNGYDEVWIHYSGHGYRIYDNSGDEVDNYDEVIIPLDYASSGVISDDYLNTHFLRKISNPNIKVFIFFDCCNSGTQMDLKYQYKDKTWIKINNNNCLGKVLFMSGCKDDQDSQEMYNINNDKKWAGAMTTSFVNYIKNNEFHIRLGNLMKVITDFIKSHGFKQNPQLCCNYKIDIDTWFIFNENIELLGGSTTQKTNNDDTIKKYIHIYKRYKFLTNKYKNNKLFYDYYNQQKNIYYKLVEDFDITKETIITENTNNVYYFKIQDIQ